MLFLPAFPACRDAGAEIASESYVPPVRADSAGVEIVQNTTPRWSDRTRWRLSERPILVIESTATDERSPLVEPVSAYRTHDGRYVVADGGFAAFNEILTFDRRGRLLSSFGSSGEGPGEFLQVWWAAPYRGDSIAVWDVTNEVSIFDSTGEFGRSTRLPNGSRTPSVVPGGYAPWAYAVYADGSFLSAPAGSADAEGPGDFWFRAELLRVRPDGERWDTLGVYPIERSRWDGERLDRLPFQRIGQRALRGEQLVFGTGERWQIDVYDPDGAPATSIRRSVPLPEVTEADMERWRAWYVSMHVSGPEGSPRLAEEVRRRVERIEPPSSKPAYSHLLVDPEGNIWAENYRWSWDELPPDPRPGAWSVFDPTGAWLGDVVVPERVLLRRVGSDHAIGFYVDEYDAKHLRVYALEKPGA